MVVVGAVAHSIPLWLGLEKPIKVLTDGDSVALEAKKAGETVEGYKILSEIGRGAASIIYLVQDPKSRRIYALKHVEKEKPKDQRFLDQAENEYNIASQIESPYIRRVTRLIKKKEKLIQTKDLWLVMELVDGTAMDMEPPAKFVDGVWIFEQVAEGLAAMHDSGFVHADMKPHNIVVDDKGNAKIIDLGQSCKTGTIKERIQGTPDYIAPEQVHRREITPKTDVYNFGATMYWVFTGENIPTALAKGDSLLGSTDDHLIEKPKRPIDINPRIHERLDDVIMHCIEVDPDRRPSTMREVAGKLNLIRGILTSEGDA